MELMNNPVANLVIEYCQAHGHQVEPYLEMIKAMHLPSRLFHLRATSQQLLLDYQRAKKFLWFVDSAFDHELEILTGIVEALVSDTSQKQVLDGDFETYPLAVFFLSRSKNGELFSDIYAVLKVASLRMSLALPTLTNSSIKTLNNIATKLRRSFQKNIARNFQADIIYLDKQKFIALLANKNNELWDVQKGLLRWLSDHHAPKTITHSNRSPVLKVNGSLADEPVQQPRVFSTILYTDDLNCGPGKQQADVLVKPSRSAEEDEQLIEVFSYQVDPEQPVSFDTALQSMLYGSRLQVQDRMLLVLRSNVFSPKELAHFVSACKPLLASTCHSNVLSAVFLLMMLLTARQTSQLMSFRISDKLGEAEEGIELKKGVWRRRSVDMPNSVRVPAQNTFVVPHTDVIDLHLPRELVDALARYAKRACLMADVLAKYNVTETTVLEQLSAIMAVFPRLNTLAQVRASFFQHLAHRHDAGFASLLLATTELHNTTPFYYKSASVDCLQGAFADGLYELGFERHPLIKAFGWFTGSHLAVDDSALAAFFAKKHKKLLALAQHVDSGSTALQFMNELALYTATVMLACTGHRTRQEYLFEPGLIHAELRLLLLADKVQFDDSAIRFVPLADVAFNALTAYAKSARRLAAYIDDKHIKRNLLEKSLWQHSAVNAPFLCQFERDSVQAINHQHLVEYLKADNLYLPLNFWRHRLCSRLSLYEAGEAVNWLLGHVGSGEHPYNLTSTLSFSDISQSRMLMNHAVAALHIKTFEGWTLRGQASQPLTKASEPYLPKYVHERRLSFKERVKYVQRLFTDFTKTLSEPTTVLEARDEFLQFAIERTADLVSREDAASCMHIVHRKIERLIQRGELPETQTWKMPITEKTTALDAQLFAHHADIARLRSALTKRSMQLPPPDTTEIALFEIVLSLIVQSAQVFQSYSVVDALQHSRFTLCGLHFVDYQDSGCLKRLYLDAITVGLIHQTPGFAAQPFQPKRFLKFLEKVLTSIGIPLSKDKYSSVQAFSQWLAFYDIHPSEPSLLRSCRLDLIESKPLSHAALARLLSRKVVAPSITILDAPMQSANARIRKAASNSNNVTEHKFFNRLMVSTRDRLLDLRNPVSIAEVVALLWQDFVQAKSTRLTDLLIASKHLSDAAVMVLLFMLEVSKRRGKGGRCISYRTLTTYFSKVCQPLIDVAQASPLLSLDEDELQDFYTAVLDARELQTRVRHAVMLRDLHQTVEKHFYLAPVNWLDIEPRIFDGDTPNFANVLTESDYLKARHLLATDRFSQESERLGQTVILILAYRCGLRRSEIKYRLQQDVCTADGLLYVSSNHYYRLKTINANRRVPASLLLDETEQHILQSLSSVAKREHDDARGRLFNISDAEFAQLCARVTEALQAVTQDASTRLHDCRHSFATHLTWLSVHRPTSLLDGEVKSWCRMEPDRFKALWLEATTGQKVNQGHKFMNTLSLAIGHSTPQTTLTHYVHELALLSFESQSSYRARFQMIEQKKLVDWFGISQVNGRKITSRSNFADDISLLQRALSSSWQLETVVQLHRREKARLLERSKVSSNYDRLLETLSEFRQLVNAVSETPFQQTLFDVFRGRESNVPIDLKLNIGTMTANKHLAKRVRRVISSPQLVSLLRHCSKLNFASLKDAAEFALSCFNVKHGYFVTESDIERLKLFESLDLGVFSTQNIVLKTANVKRIGCSAKLRWQQRDVSDDFFVVSILICASSR